MVNGESYYRNLINKQNFMSNKRESEILYPKQYILNDNEWHNFILKNINKNNFFTKNHLTVFMVC